MKTHIYIDKETHMIKCVFSTWEDEGVTQNFEMLVRSEECGSFRTINLQEGTRVKFQYPLTESFMTLHALAHHHCFVPNYVVDALNIKSLRVKSNG